MCFASPEFAQAALKGSFHTISRILEKPGKLKIYSFSGLPVE
jgi:hypothetical protein